MGGKGSSAPAVQDTGVDSAMQAMMAMSSMNAMNAQMPQQPEMATMPETTTSEEIDWTDQNAKLAAKAKADYNVDKAKRKGRAETVHSSPLLEEEDTATTAKTLGGA